MKRLKIAIVGANGLVGQKILQVLKEEKIFDVSDIDLFSSEKTAGQSIEFSGHIFKLLKLSGRVKKKYDIAFFSAGEEVSRKYAMHFVSLGAFVIDNTNAFRRNGNIPLVVPEINADQICERTKLISNPNCTTIQLAVVISKLQTISKIKKIIVSTYQSVSGAGKLALEDLIYDKNEYFKQGIKDNLIPAIGEILPTGYSVEEDKIMFELNKILKANIDVCATAVRVPMPYTHGESVYVQFEENVKLDDLEKSLDSKEIKYSASETFVPKECEGSNQTFVCRLRKFSENEVCFFEIADNLRRGASYNAVLIAKTIIAKFYK